MAPVFSAFNVSIVQGFVKAVTLLNAYHLLIHRAGACMVKLAADVGVHSWKTALLLRNLCTASGGRLGRKIALPLVGFTGTGLVPCLILSISPLLLSSKSRPGLTILSLFSLHHFCLWKVLHRWLLDALTSLRPKSWFFPPGMIRISGHWCPKVTDLFFCWNWIDCHRRWKCSVFCAVAKGKKRRIALRSRKTSKGSSFQVRVMNAGRGVFFAK